MSWLTVRKGPGYPFGSYMTLYPSHAGSYSPFVARISVVI